MIKKLTMALGNCCYHGNHGYLCQLMTVNPEYKIIYIYANPQHDTQ